MKNAMTENRIVHASALLSPTRQCETVLTDFTT